MLHPSFRLYLASLSPRIERSNPTWKSSQLLCGCPAAAAFTLHAERKEKEDGTGWFPAFHGEQGQEGASSEQSRMLRTTLGLEVEIKLKGKRAGAKGVQKGPKSLPSRLDPSTYSTSPHFYFAPLPLAFPTGDAPSFAT